MPRTLRIAACVLFAMNLCCPGGHGAGLPSASPEALGLDPVRLRKLDEAIDRAIAGGSVPGAVVMVGRRGKIVYARAAGLRAVEPPREAMTRDTIFDMASLTKPVVTATAVLILVEEGRLRLEDRVGKFLPELNNHGKEAITVEHLLRHRAGLVPDNPLKDYEHGAEAAWKRITDIELTAPPGRRFVYSDVGFLILGKLVERVSGKRLDEFASERIFRVADMPDAHFRPTTAERNDAGAEGRIAPTERASPGGPMLRGVVHDPRARALGGVAGHAGLFATADDLAAFASGLLGESGDGRILSPLAVRAMIHSGSTPPGQRRGLGWDIETSYSTPRGALFGPGSFGHTGFTGTSLWIDPETGVFVIVLTSRLHPDGKKPAPSALRAEVATLAAAAIRDLPVRGAPAGQGSQDQNGNIPNIKEERSVRCGIDVLVEDGFRLLRGRRVGLVTNQTGRTRSGRSTIDILFQAPEVTLVRLFSPEHGIRGELDARVPDGRDATTGLPIVSLYGTRQKPGPADLAYLDVLVYDIQDIGTRYYTYNTTLGLVLEAAAEEGKPVVVLDRPNPIGGVAVAGPVRDAEFASFIAYHPLPVRHGMTSGELARLYQGERGLKVRLDVVACRGWTREQTYDRTGLVWINPSPNMRSLTEAMLYPGVGWLEATNLATGRGTDAPFERVGAPWVEPREFSQDLNALGLIGVRFVPIWFTPTERQFKGERCGGVQIVITDWAAFDPLRLGLGLAATLRSLYREHWNPEGLLRMLADRASYEAILAGQGVAAVAALWEPELEEFRRVRSRYLIYRSSGE
jgi:uncharacterized protein YbbC (DUF1343 family)/CubicO group peptidase (beta-lactamase class C family)